MYDIPRISLRYSWWRQSIHATTDCRLPWSTLTQYCLVETWVLFWVTDHAQHITSRDLGLAAWATLVKVNDLVFLMTSGNRLLDRRAKWSFSIDFSKWGAVKSPHKVLKRIVWFHHTWDFERFCVGDSNESDSLVRILLRMAISKHVSISNKSEDELWAQVIIACLWSPGARQERFTTTTTTTIISSH
jgi:hypothetical protein